MSLIEKAAKILQATQPSGIERAQQASPSIQIAIPVETPQEDKNTQPLCHLDFDFLRAQHIITPHLQYSAMAEEFRVIKRPLLDAATNTDLRHGNLIMIASSLPGEGKTHCAVNLAMSISMEVEKTVLLIDGDVSKPSVLSLLGINKTESPLGLLDLLQEGTTLSPPDVLLRTNIPNLSLMPAGQRGRYSTELLASEAMGKLLHDISCRYPDRVIIVDSPPLLLTTESRALAAHMGQIVLVVESGKSYQSAVARSLSILNPLHATGVIMNKVRPSLASHPYGYGYGYGE